jgi:acetyltransferase
MDGRRRLRGIKLGIENLNCFFNPKTIAVIGASERKTSLGGLIFRNLLGTYQGLVFPVNEFRQTVQGVKAYPSISKVPSKIDLAIVATPAHTIPQIVEECGKAGVAGIIIVSAGFSTCDSVGQNLTRQIIERSIRYGTRIIGPNSLGVMRPKNNLYATFGDKKAVPGKIAFISQSAALCGTVLDWSQETKVGLSAVVSLGSMVDVNLSDLIEHFGADSQTRAIMLYVESIKDVRSFISAARGFARTKPIVIVKAGRFNKDRDIVLSNVTRMTEDDVYDAAFRRIGMVRVDTVNELFDCAKALSMQPNPNNPCLTIITNADGPGVLAADQLNLKGGQLSPVSDTSASTLKGILPYYCRVSNPIDLLEEATPERFRDALQICLNDPAIESVLLIYSPQGVTKPSSMAGITVDLSKKTRKTLLVSLMGEDPECQEARRTLNLNGIPAFRTPEEAVTAFMYMYSYTRNLELLYQTPEEIELNLDNPLCIKGVIRRACTQGRHVLSLPESLSVLETYKIPTAKTYVAKTSQEASVITSELGFPVTMKALQETPSSDNAGGRFTVDVYSASDVPCEFNSLVEKITFISLHGFQGVAVQPKIQRNGCELFLGLRKHANFGSLIVLGRVAEPSGILNDIAVGFPPLNQVLARQLTEKAKISQHDNKAPVPCESSIVEKIIVRFSQLVVDFPEIKEINLNPLVVNGADATVVDASVTIDMNRVMREPADHDENLVIAPYPKKYVTQRALKNGLVVTLRPVKPEDELRFNELFRSLSQESVRFRFFEIIKEMSHDTLSRYCNLDYDREIAIVAELQNDGRIIGVVRLILDSDRKKGEFAVMVGDAWHGLGLGSKLMDYIIGIAKDLKLEAIYSLISSANYKMVNLCGKMGFENEPIDEYTVEMRKNLPA